jgi:archaellum component FlaG (FlaF/FlaG flagellin family)
MKVAKICVATIGGAFFVRSNGAHFLFYQYCGIMEKFMKNIVSLIVLTFLLLVFSSCSYSDVENMNYFNSPFQYDNLEIAVKEVKEICQENGFFSTTITFLIKNIGEETNSFDLDDVFLKNEATKEEYTRAELFSHENIKVGESKEYKIKFTIPSSVSAEKYILCFGFAGRDAKCALYYESGEMLKIETLKLYHDNNIQALSSHFEAELVEEILSGLEKTNVLKDNTRLNSDWIVKRDTSSFEIYIDFSVIISVNGDKFKIFTYKTEYNEATAILLYDSTNPSEMKTLSETERESFRSTQRKYQVQSTIEISPSLGSLLHNQFGNTYFSFSVKNKSNSSFVYIEITFTPSFPGYEGELKKKSYTFWNEIQIGESKKFELKTTGWEKYDFFEVTDIVIMFGDGTSVKFNEYDCQFLRDQ